MRSAEHQIVPATKRPLFVLPFAAIDASFGPIVGGKGANLGVLTNAGFPVPPGFCITTEAYKAFVSHPSHAPAIEKIFVEMAQCKY